MSFIQDFKAFALKGNVVDMAVGVIIGGAFGKIVTSVVNNIIMPPIGVLTGGVDFTDLKIVIKDAVMEGDQTVTEAVTLNYGQFIQDVVDCNLIQMAGKVMDLLRSRYLVSPIRYEGMQRIEELEIPQKALRELIYNAIVHKLYSGPAILMRVFDKSVELWNYGLLPEELTPADLMKKHASYPRNRNIASAFYKAGFIETWGRGYKKIREEFEKAGLPVPTVEESGGGVLVTIRRKTMEDIIAGRDKSGAVNGTVNGTVNNESGTVNSDATTLMELTARQKRIKELIRLKPTITILQMTTTLSIPKRTLQRDLSVLQKAKVIRHEGSDKSGTWVVLEPYNNIVGMEE